MEVSDNHGPAVLRLGKKPGIWEAEWAPEPVWTLSENKIYVN